MTTIELPLRLVSVANVREAWQARARRTKLHRNAAVAVPRVPLPVLVTITRLGPRALDDDNLSSSAKALRDGIAARLGVDDGRTDLIRFRYAQEKSKAYGVRVTLEPLIAS
jgi:hypothetical protein